MSYSLAKIMAQNRGVGKSFLCCAPNQEHPGS
ncbi:hypothetical protein FHX76_000240 [Lysinibacter cavernae]|uniref:Uncharacterized protein n=1 Tax=Lysinibacter cavernae TaxID=1640652 RepID=A0A7X5TT62_9MICO|nr:hypothetical protein [Lysinibacter cavernae]